MCCCHSSRMTCGWSRHSSRSHHCHNDHNDHDFQAMHCRGGPRSPPVRVGVERLRHHCLHHCWHCLYWRQHRWVGTRACRTRACRTRECRTRECRTRACWLLAHQLQTVSAAEPHRARREHESSHLRVSQWVSNLAALLTYARSHLREHKVRAEHMRWPRCNLGGGRDAIWEVQRWCEVVVLVMWCWCW